MADVRVTFDPKKLLDELVDQTLLFRLGTETIAVIRARTNRGQFLEGSTSLGYSTRPAPMPLGGVRLKSAQAKILSMLKKGDESVRAYTSKTGKVWVTLMGGYRQLRELAGRQTAVVNLQWSGAMMRSLHIADLDLRQKTVTIGFSDEESAERAGFHHAGAGRSRIKRIFVGLSQNELDQVIRKVGL